jgi:hypothetical protein
LIRHHGGIRMGDGRYFHIRQLRKVADYFARMAFEIEQTEADFVGQTQFGAGDGS